jgi:hypothetical protein
MTSPPAWFWRSREGGDEVSMNKPSARELLDWIHKVHTETGCTCEKHRLPCDAENLAARVEKVLVHHQKVPGDPTAQWYEQRVQHCLYCGTPWPCSTVCLLNGDEP